MLVALLFVLPTVVFGQAPPPPGVPIDFGISALVAATVGYGAYKLRKDKE